jgi:hypothetical protein
MRCAEPCAEMLRAQAFWRTQLINTAHGAVLARPARRERLAVATVPSLEKRS